MTTANTPTSSVTLRFPPAESSVLHSGAQESYQLLELPPEILKRVEGSKEVFPLTIKGKPDDDAVLCTPDSTFSLRSVLISNSLLVCRDPSSSSHSRAKRPRREDGEGRQGANSGSTLQVRDVCHQVIECIPLAPNLERIRSLLKPTQWQGMDAAAESMGRSRGDDEIDDVLGGGRRKRKIMGDDKVIMGKGKGRAWTRDQLTSVIQASDAELESGLRERNVIQVNGRMLLLPSKHLVPLLELVLTLLTIHRITPDSSANPKAKTKGGDRTVLAKIEPIVKTLNEDHDLPREFILGVLDLYNTSSQGKDTTECGMEDWSKDEVWECRVGDVVEEMGKGLLEELPGRGVSLDEFLSRWRGKVGDEWADMVDIKLLEGNYLLESPTLSLSSSSSSSNTTITHFPEHELPLNPATRISDLFLTRPKWRAEEMTPFLKGLTRPGDVKARDKLVSKFARVVKDKEGVWWYPRKM